MKTRRFRDEVVRNIYLTMRDMSGEVFAKVMERPVGQQDIAFTFGYNGKEYPAYFGGSKTSACYAAYCAGLDRRSAETHDAKFLCKGATSVKTRDDVEHLKRDWLSDPCWDIEATEGFEEHREELSAFRKNHEAKWEQNRKEKLLAKANQLGVPGNTALAEYVLQMEYRLEKIEEKLGI